MGIAVVRATSPMPAFLSATLVPLGVSGESVDGCGYRDLWTAADGPPSGKHVFKVTVEPSLIWSVMGPSQIVQMTPTPLWCLIHLARRASQLAGRGAI